jgi:hypothetical protein
MEGLLEGLTTAAIVLGALCAAAFLAFWRAS